MLPSQLRPGHAWTCQVRSQWGACSDCGPRDVKSYIAISPSGEVACTFKFTTYFIQRALHPSGYSIAIFCCCQFSSAELQTKIQVGLCENHLSTQQVGCSLKRPAEICRKKNTCCYSFFQITFMDTRRTTQPHWLCKGWKYGGEEASRFPVSVIVGSWKSGTLTRCPKTADSTDWDCCLQHSSQLRLERSHGKQTGVRSR